MLGLVQYVYVMARRELVRVALRVRMDLSVGPEWTKWALDRGSGGSWFPNPYWSSNCWDSEQIQQMRQRLLTAQSQQESYADRRRSELEFQVDDLVLLKASLWRGVIRFKKWGKLGFRYIGPFHVIAGVGRVA